MRYHSILLGAHAFLPPVAAIAGLTTELAGQRPPASDHSVAEIVAHMAFWQDWFLDRCHGVATLAPMHADAGWPAVATVAWDVIHQKFETGFTRALELAADDARTSLPVSPALEASFLEKYTVGDALTHIALHNAHHVGQVITLRQQLGIWPPPAGRYTW